MPPATPGLLNSLFGAPDSGRDAAPDSGRDADGEEQPGTGAWRGPPSDQEVGGCLSQSLQFALIYIYIHIHIHTHTHTHIYIYIYI